MNRSASLILCGALIAACDGYDNEQPELAAELDESGTSDAAGESSGFEADDDSGDETAGSDTGSETGAANDDVDGDDGGEADSPELSASLDPLAAASTDPLLKFVLYSQPGVARLVRVDPSTGVANTVATHSFSSHWVPVGVAGDKLIWQRSDTGDISLWTIDANGNYAGHVFLSPPADWKVRGISFDQDGQCPSPSAAQASYTILLEGPPSSGWFAQWPSPVLWHVDNNGTVDSTESFGVSYPWATLRDFRLTPEGYGGLIYKNLFSFGSDGTAIDWYGRDDDGDLQRLRTDQYSPTAGYTGCTAHEPGVVCHSNYVDEAPGSGHSLTSMLTTATAGGNNLPTSYLMWTKTDGTAKSYRLQRYSGRQLAPSATVVTPHAGASAVSVSGDTPQVCPIFVPPQNPPSLPGAPVLEPPGCPWC